MPFAHADGTEIRPKRRCMRPIKVLIGVDPHKASVADATVEEIAGELVERSGFLPGPRRPESPRALGEAIPRASLGGGERRRARSAPGGEVGCGPGESVVDVPPKLSTRVRVLSTGNTRKYDGLDALATTLAASRSERLAAVDAEATSEMLRLLSERREDLVAERTRALNRLHGLLRCPAG